MPDSLSNIATDKLNAHLGEILDWHFSAETGCPYWLDWKTRTGIDPRTEVKTVEDLAIFGAFNASDLRDLPHEKWAPKAYSGRPFKVFETGGTTGKPIQRLSWEDHLTDYSLFSESLSGNAFPKGANWLILGPTGPRRLRISMEHLANLRGGSAYHVDLDPRWVRKCIAKNQLDEAEAYLDHVISQGQHLIESRDIQCIFTTPAIIEALAFRMSLEDAGVRGVLIGGTALSPQVTRFLREELIGENVLLTPVYGNTLMGLAASAPTGPETGYEVVYYAPQPRAVLKTVDESGAIVGYGERGRVVLTTLTKELFLPLHFERDEAIRRPPTPGFAWDGLGDLRPWRSEETPTIEGVY